jgi:hypothetical protein
MFSKINQSKIYPSPPHPLKMNFKKKKKLNQQNWMNKNTLKKTKKKKKTN